MMAGKRYLHFIKGDLAFGANFSHPVLKNIVEWSLGTLPLSPRPILLPYSEAE